MENAPDDRYWTFLLLSVTRARMGDLAGTRAALERARELKPGSAEVHFYLGNVWHREGKPEIAADLFRVAIRLDSSVVGYYLNLGAVLEENHRSIEARDVYRTALEKAPEDSVLKERLARVKRVLSESP